MLLVAQAFERLGTPYAVVGSVASSLYGTPRSTNDIDFLAALREQSVSELDSALSEAFFVDTEMIRDAIRHGDSFNILHRATMQKADVFVVGGNDARMEELERARSVPLGPEADAPRVLMASPEDVILSKLNWFRLTGGRSDRQWSDVLGVIKVQTGSVDLSYLRARAQARGLGDLLSAALSEAGVEE